jgi:hypothetical protein
MSAVAPSFVILVADSRSCWFGLLWRSLRSHGHSFHPNLGLHTKQTVSFAEVSRENPRAAQGDSVHMGTNCDNLIAWTGRTLLRTGGIDAFSNCRRVLRFRSVDGLGLMGHPAFHPAVVMKNGQAHQVHSQASGQGGASRPSSLGPGEGRWPASAGHGVPIPGRHP